MPIGNCLDNDQQLAIVTGAFGYSGKYITRRLLESGVTVKTLTNHPGPASQFAKPVEVIPLNFSNLDALAESLRGADTLVNTYWIRFAHRGLTHERAVENIKTLIAAARQAGVRRFVQISITSASASSPLPYFRGKGIIEDTLRASGLSYAIVRPTVIFGPEDILINNIAWSLRTFPLFMIPGDGEYRLQPVFVEDLAELVVDASRETRNVEIDAVGPEVFTFNELVALLGRTLGIKPRTLHVPPIVALSAASVIGWLKGDVMLTADEIRGLSANLLVSQQPPTTKTRLSAWLRENAATIGAHYFSELARRT